MMDPIIIKVVDKILGRSKRGIEKYGTTLEENNTDDFLKHLQEELMDAVNYIEKLIQQNEQTITANKKISSMDRGTGNNDFKIPCSSGFSSRDFFSNRLCNRRCCKLFTDENPD